MAKDFDPIDKTSWYFGPLSREETNEIFDHVHTNGVFLVRESQSIKGDFVLCVREDNKVSHYIINRTQVGGNTMFRIGDQQFPDIPALLNFYKTHYLDTTALTVPAPRERVVTKYDFPGKDQEDLPFKKGEILEIISKDEDKWWMAKNKDGRTGQIPVPYVTKYTGAANHNSQLIDIQPREPEVAPAQAPLHLPKELPAKAIVIQERIPSLYDSTQLRLHVGEVITVTKINANGQWEGEINDKKGIFPFTYVKFLDETL